MAVTEIEHAFSTLTEKLSVTESEINQEITNIQQQIQGLKDKVIELQTQQEMMSTDKSTIQDMYNKYCGGNKSGAAIEF